MKQYRRYISILNLQWRYTWRIFIGILGFLVVTQGFFLYRQMRNASFTQELTNWTQEGTNTYLIPWSLRLEEYMARSYIKEIFLISLILTVILLITVSFWQRSNSNIDYTIMRLPVRGKTWYVISFFHALLHFVILISVQMGMIFAAYGMYMRMVPEDVQMTQALVLSFFRWDFLRGLYPIGNPLQQNYCILVFISLSILVVYLQICIIKKRNFVFSLLVCGFAYMSFFDVLSVNGAYFNMFLIVLISGIMMINMRIFLREE